MSGSQIPRTPNSFVVHCMNQSLCGPKARHYLLQRCGEDAGHKLCTLPSGRLGVWHMIGFRDEAKGRNVRPPRQPLGTVWVVSVGEILQRLSRLSAVM